MSNNQSVVDALHAPTPKERINFRVGYKNKTNTKACMLAYVDARYVMDRLDEAVGNDRWSTEYKMVGDNQFCAITVSWPDGTTTCKMDCGMETEVDAEKGQASDAFKRAAVHYGIGRDLYSMPQHWATLENGYVDRNWIPEGWDSSAAQQQNNSTPTTTTTVTASQPPTNEAQEKIDRMGKQAEERGEGVEVKAQKAEPSLKQGTPPEDEFVRIKNLRLVRSSDKSHLLIPDSFKGDTGDFEKTKPYWIPKSKISDLTAMPSGKYTLDVSRWIAEQTLDDGSPKFVFEEISASKPKEESSEVSTTIDDDDLPF